MYALISLALLGGCGNVENDPFYQNAQKVEDKLLELTKAAIDAGEYNDAKLDALRDEAAQAGGFANAAAATAKMNEYLKSEDQNKVAVAKAVVDLAMQTNKKIDQYIDMKKKSQ